MCGDNWGTWGQHGDSKEVMNEKLLEALTLVKEHYRYSFDCHFMPQAAYVYGWTWNTTPPSFGSDWSEQRCKHVLHYEPDFVTAFNEIMDEHGYTYRLSKTELRAGTKSNDRFRFTPEDLSDDVVELANDVVHDDF